MKSFHGDKKIKAKYVKRVQDHILADELVRGEGWDGTKGCAVGCTLNDYNHLSYETELGIPEWLARVEDTLFEGMSETKSRIWPSLFLKSISVGVDLEPIKAQFVVVVLKHSLKSMRAAKFDTSKYPEVKQVIGKSIKAVKQMIKAQETGRGLQSAESAAARAAASAASARAAESAAWAAESAESAAARAAAAAWSAWSAASARAAAESAWSASYNYYADELIKLLKKTK